MERRKNRLFGLAMILVLIGIAFSSCKYDYLTHKEPEEPMTVASCEGCHINYEHLLQVYSPDTAAPVGGCGGDAPHYEPYDRVYMGGDGYEAFKESSHYEVGCTGCHNGVDNTDDKNTAHSGDFIRHPSMFASEKCSSCHQDVVNNYATSLHNGTGQKRKVTMRSGLAGPQEFDQLPPHQIEGYNANCATCHGTCGNCHVVRPPIAGGGLSKSHVFTKSPDMLNICVSCHTSRGGHAYLGRGPGTVPDVHLTKAGMECIDCHTGAELHGDGKQVDQRYAYMERPNCKNCHSDLDQSNQYHTIHLNTFNCQVCHSQDYNNCGSCHIHGEGARVPSYMDYKIAKNPLFGVVGIYNFTLVRRTLAAPDNWEEYGVDEYANFEAFPTYNYTTPHNILKWTSRTVQDGDCFSKCHIRNDGGNLINAELYLWADSLETWEVSATSGICVDGLLPSDWFTK